jgi:threonine aldolase
VSVPGSVIDLRSDTVTRPGPAMREAMARAEVGDDVYGEDPTVIALEAEVAALAGKEAALFVPSGTMSNQIALLCHCRRGDEVYVGQGAHVFFNESGAGGAWAGVQFLEVGGGGLYTAAELEQAIKPDVYYLPRPRLVAVENTHNRAGGTVFPQADVEAIAGVARAHGLGLHLDGARIWNAAAATGLTVRELAAPFDTVSVCFSKGLGAPVGSALCGPRALIADALRFRKMLGGGMRQAGILAAAARYALDHHQPRIGEDHANASSFARALASASPHAVVGAPQTNIVNVDLPVPAATVAAAARELGLLVGASAARRLRAVFHLDVPPESALRAAQLLARAIESCVDPASPGGAPRP